MAKTVYVFSTLTSDVAYTFHRKGGADLPEVEHTILIKGGANVANDRLITPLGVATEISEEDAALLDNHGIFKIHKENGHMVIQSRSADADKVAKDMTKKDKSAPLTPDDYKKGNKGKNVIDIDDNE